MVPTTRRTCRRTDPSESSATDDVVRRLDHTARNVPSTHGFAKTYRRAGLVRTATCRLRDHHTHAICLPMDLTVLTCMICPLMDLTDLTCPICPPMDPTVLTCMICPPMDLMDLRDLTDLTHTTCAAAEGAISHRTDRESIRAKYTAGEGVTCRQTDRGCTHTTCEGDVVAAICPQGDRDRGVGVTCRQTDRDLIIHETCIDERGIRRRADQSDSIIATCRLDKTVICRQADGSLVPGRTPHRTDEQEEEGEGVPRVQHPPTTDRSRCPPSSFQTSSRAAASPTRAG
jgi:hypothetical protein